jgi:hypothetical protein
MGRKMDIRFLMFCRIMKNLRPFTFNEKFAAVLLVLFFPVYVVTAFALRPGSVLAAQDFAAFLFWKIAWFFLGAIAVCTATVTLFSKPSYHPSHWRMHIGRVFPMLALMVATLLSFAVDNAMFNRQMRNFAQLHDEELAGYSPRAILYREGIPDGGVANVRLPGRNPEGLNQRTMVELTGERIRSCRPISNSDWSCHFD